MIFSIGDLVHIPQDILLFNASKTSLHRTKEPATAIVVKVRTCSDPHIAIYIQGKEMMARSEDIYPMRIK